MGDVVNLPDLGGVRYVNENILPIADETIKADFPLQVFISACLNGAVWWADKAGAMPVTKMSEPEVRACIEEADKYAGMCIALLEFLPRKGANSRSEVIQELSEVVVHIDKLWELSDEVAKALEVE